MQPFLKWPGGKRWLLQNHRDIFPQKFNRYYEPFLGGGAAFFSLLPKEATISDVNSELINLYLVMRDQPEQLRDAMLQHQSQHSTDYYYQIRAAELKTPLERAARSLYLNRTCYNGMYRVNKSGQFNVPIGTKTDCVYDVDFFTMYSLALQKATIQQSDFAEAIDTARTGDLIFADPPYATSTKNGFIKYNGQLFTWEDQQRLMRALVMAKKRGVFIVVANANCDEIQKMYTDNGFNIHFFQRSSTIAGKSSTRKKVQELIATSY